jgi:hypothetical protein
MNNLPLIHVKMRASKRPIPVTAALSRVRAFATVTLLFPDISSIALEGFRVLSVSDEPPEVLMPSLSGCSVLRSAVTIKGRLHDAVKEAVLAEYERLRSSRPSPYFCMRSWRKHSGEPGIAAPCHSTHCSAPENVPDAR